MKSKYWVPMLALICTVILAAFGSLAAAEGVEPFALKIEGTVVKSYTGDPSTAPATLVIPEGITEINTAAFEASRNGPIASTKVSFPSSLTSIGHHAFKDCINLKTISFAAGTRELKTGQLVFSGCTALNGVAFPEGLRRLNAERCLFSGCTSLGSVSFPSSLAELSGFEMFGNCTSLKSVTFPASIISLSANSMFSGCTSLTSVKFLCSPTSFNGYAMFSGCTSLTSVKFLSLPITFSGSYMFSGCTSMTTVPDVLPGLESGMFCGCTGLTSVNIPMSWISYGSIPSRAFADCTALQSVTVTGDSDTPLSVGSSAFSGCKALSNFTIQPDIPVSVSKQAFKGCKALKTLNKPLNSIEDEAFIDSGITAVTILPSVRQIGFDAFFGVNPVISGYIGSFAENYAKQNGHTFAPLTLDMKASTEQTKFATSVHFKYQEGTKSYIGSYTLEVIYQDSEVGSVNFWENKGEASFGISMKEAMKVGKSYNFTVNAIIELDNGTDIQLGSTSVTYKYTGEAYLPPTYTERTGVYSIKKGQATYKKAVSKAKKQTIPDILYINGETVPVIAIAAKAFSGDKTLVTVQIGRNVASIGKNAFMNCTALKKVKGCSSVKEIGNNAFKGCKVLATFPTMGTLAKIGASAFESCVKLPKFLLSTNVTSIGKKAFFGCKALKKINVKTTKLGKSSIKANAFKGLPKNVKFTFPKSKAADYKTYFKKAGAPIK